MENREGTYVINSVRHGDTYEKKEAKRDIVSVGNYESSCFFDQTKTATN